MTDNCAVLLAGGKSRRMGINKAFLKLNGRSFAEIMLETLCRLNVDEILVSCEPEMLLSACKNGITDQRIRVVPDMIKDKGPLGGLYSCFCSTSCTSAIVTAIDTPLITADTLRSLLSHHTINKTDATVLTAASHIEPLIAAYSTGTRTVIKDLIDKDKLSVRHLLDRIDTYYLESVKDPSELWNCNTQDDYSRLLSL